ncbi:MAG: hypothetical protein ACREOA_01545 [Candidatus Dormibacteria bacterium]
MATATAGIPGLSQVNPILPVAAEADLRSCDYQLTDRPAARPFLTAARLALVQAGLVSAAQANDDVLADVSDDPDGGDNYIVSLDFQGTQTSPPPGAPPGDSFYGLAVYSVVETASADPVAVGPAPW